MVRASLSLRSNAAVRACVGRRRRGLELAEDRLRDRDCRIPRRRRVAAREAGAASGHPRAFETGRCPVALPTGYRPPCSRRPPIRSRSSRSQASARSRRSFSNCASKLLPVPFPRSSSARSRLRSAPAPRSSPSGSCSSCRSDKGVEIVVGGPSCLDREEPRNHAALAARAGSWIQRRSGAGAGSGSIQAVPAIPLRFVLVTKVL